MEMSREDLLIVAERMRAALSNISLYVTSEEGDEEATEEELGISTEEVIEMAHDNMIEIARETLQSSSVRQFCRYIESLAKASANKAFRTGDE